MDQPYPTPTGNNASASGPQPPEVLTLAPPDHLTGDTQALWQKVAADFQKAGLLKAVDLFKFGHYLFAITQAQKLMHEIATEGGEINQPNKKGFVTASHHPRVQQYLGYVQLADKLGAQFGDSPAARAKLGKILEEQKSGLQKFVASKPK